MKTKHENTINDIMHQNPDNWKAGIFYYNTNDPRILVPKRNRLMGWTLNFANPYSYISLTAIVAVIILFSVLG